MVTDVTQIRINDKKVYLSAIIDLYSNEVLAYDVRNSPNQEQINNTLTILVSENTLNDEVILHSDKGWLYQLDSYQNQLREHHIKQSVSLKENWHDNVSIESFFGLLKRKFVFKNKFTNVSDFISRFKNYIKWFGLTRKE